MFNRLSARYDNLPFAFFVHSMATIMPNEHMLIMMILTITATGTRMGTMTVYETT